MAKQFGFEQGLDWPIFLLVGWILITIPFAVDQAHSFGEWRKLAGRFLLFYWALLVFRMQRQDTLYYQLALVAVLGASVISVYGIWDYFERGGTIVDAIKSRGNRAYAPSSHSHWLATYLVLVFPIVSHFL